MLLEDYNYFINKAVQQYINLIYAKLEIDQQSTDDIRVLKTSAVLEPKKLAGPGSDAYSQLADGMFKSSYYVDLPADYMHLLNCIVEYKVNASNFKCYNKGDTVYFAARRLTPDMYTQVLNNAYMRPMYKRPYYYLNNINTSLTLATNPSMDNAILDANKKGEENPVPTSQLVDSVTTPGNRLSNPSTVRLELRYGNDDGVFQPNNIYVDYLKSPMYIRLTQEQINATLDFSQVLEFPDYVCFEIANIFVRLLMENSSDPRLQTNMPINNTIAAPAVMQAAQQQTQQR